MMLVVLVTLLLGSGSCTGGRTASKSDRRVCMKLTEDSCLALSPEYPTVSLKNQNDYTRKLIEFRGYNSFVEDSCQEIFHAFTCVAYFPRCSDSAKHTILPCRSLCERARAECEEKLNSTGIKWPKRLNCNKFPRSADKICVNYNGDVSTTQPPPLTSTSESCESMDIPFCDHLGYNLTHRPQNFPEPGYDVAWQLQAQSRLQTFNPLIQTGCSPDTKLLLCSVYAPECTESQDTILPCRSLCKFVKGGCLDILTTFGFSWPDSLRCDTFPTTNCREPSSSIQASTTPEPDVCQPITSELCSSDIGYSLTHFPNSDFETQEDAALEVHQYYLLVQLDCFPELREFLCAVYIPECTEFRERVPPCRSLCESAKSGCQEIMTQYSVAWPAILECSKFPDTDCRGEQPATPVSDLSSQVVCEAITNPMCGSNIGYNLTHFPNSDFQSQEDAALEVHQFYPLVKVGCSSDLHEFLCAVYIPECTENRERIQPCRSLCESAKSGCRELMEKFSFSWPEKLECSNFPVTDCKGGTSMTRAPGAELTRQATSANLMQDLNETISDIAAYAEELASSSSRRHTLLMGALRSSVSSLRIHAERIETFLRVLEKFNDED